MILTVEFQDRDFSTRPADSAVRYTVEEMSWTTEGGPKTARLRADGTQRELKSTEGLLRCPAIIYRDGTPIWWGYVETVKLWANSGYVQSASVKEMKNRVRTKYTLINPGDEWGGDEAVTAWVERTGSMSYYGTREYIATLGEGTAEQALALANRVMNDYSWPMATHDLSNMGTSTEQRGQLDLRGWFDTLDWKHYAKDAGWEGFDDVGDGVQAIGDNAARTKCAQSFQLLSTAGWVADTVMVRMRKEGAPADNVTVEIYSDSAGAPGTLLTTSTLAASSISENLNWITFTFSRYLLAPATTYWLVISRSGALSATNYYKVDGNENLGYTRGVFRLWNGSAWVARSPDADLMFQVIGIAMTTNQLKYIIDDVGQFFAGRQVINDSLVYSSPYRDGERTGLACAVELLRSGTTNYRRVMATVGVDRYVTFEEEPAPGARDYSIDVQGRIWDNYGAEVWRESPPVGVWLVVKELFDPLTAEIGIVDLGRVFVEEATWTKGKIKWKFRGMQSLVDNSD